MCSSAMSPISTLWYFSCQARQIYITSGMMIVMITILNANYFIVVAVVVVIYSLRLLKILIWLITA